ncbi:MAG: type II toxin-antitoxin system RelE/ParE family toxin [Clostridia bacterium]|nr:type II toxin-antitoxin system RelE/ParE family toxin [Clostridia bacterium]
MAYQVKLTPNAIRQLQDTLVYISQTLQAPDVARRWSKRLESRIASLCEMPFRYALVEEDPWHGEGVRKMPVENFIVYYWADDRSSTVWVIAVIYGKRDLRSALRNMPNDLT